MNTNNPGITYLLDTAEKAADSFNTYSTAQIKSILHALGEAGKEKARFYAKWSVEDTGRGNIDDNIKKLRFCITDLANRYSPADFIEPVTDREKNMISFPKPAGILAALIPGTNPMMTIYYKTLFSIMTRNVIIFSPHPAAKACAIDAVDFMARIAEDAGAPKGTIQILRMEGISYLNDLMEAPKVNLILATGGPGRVKAAYRSGNPALGMGPGNAPCYVHQSADIRTAAQQIIRSNSFDHALPCVCESVIIADRDIDASLQKAIGSSGGYFIPIKDEHALYEFLYPEGQMNTEAIGKSAAWIAEQAGITIPPDVKSLIVKINQVVKDQPLSQEKMFPVMGYIVVDGIEQAIDTALAMLQHSGKGHSAIIHSNDPSVVSRYATIMPVCRIAVNTQGVEGSGGMSTHLTPGPMVGTGFFGGSSVDDNISPKHLIQWCRVAYPKDAVLAEVETRNITK